VAGREGALLEILPAGAMGAELLDEEGDVLPGELFAEERAAIADASDGRRREFLGGRVCARRALELLGISPVAVPIGVDGAPVWSDRIVGSITHKGRYRAAAVAFASDVAGLGIDAELNAPLPAGVIERIASPAEIEEVERLLADRPGLAWDRLLFSAKESAVKAVQTLYGDSQGLAAVGVGFDADTRAFTGAARLAREMATGATSLDGRWELRAGLLIVAAWPALAG
jgi:4'-phosphopantetheinyl transferase EntD